MTSHVLPHQRQQSLPGLRTWPLVAGGTLQIWPIGLIPKCSHVIEGVGVNFPWEWKPGLCCSLKWCYNFKHYLCETTYLYILLLLHRPTFTFHLWTPETTHLHILLLRISSGLLSHFTFGLPHHSDKATILFHRKSILWLGNGNRCIMWLDLDTMATHPYPYIWSLTTFP